MVDPLANGQVNARRVERRAIVEEHPADIKAAKKLKNFYDAILAGNPAWSRCKKKQCRASCASSKRMTPTAGSGKLAPRSKRDVCRLALAIAPQRFVMPSERKVEKQCHGGVPRVPERVAQALHHCLHFTTISRSRTSCTRGGQRRSPDIDGSERGSARCLTTRLILTFPKHGRFRRVNLATPHRDSLFSAIRVQRGGSKFCASGRRADRAYETSPLRLSSPHAGEKGRQNVMQLSYCLARESVSARLLVPGASFGPSPNEAGSQMAEAA